MTMSRRAVTTLTALRWWTPRSVRLAVWLKRTTGTMLVMMVGENEAIGDVRPLCDRVAELELSPLTRFLPVTLHFLLQITCNKV